MYPFVLKFKKINENLINTTVQQGKPVGIAAWERARCHLAVSVSLILRMFFCGPENRLFLQCKYLQALEGAFGTDTVRGSSIYFRLQSMRNEIRHLQWSLFFFFFNYLLSPPRGDRKTSNFLYTFSLKNRISCGPVKKHTLCKYLCECYC